MRLTQLAPDDELERLAVAVRPLADEARGHDVLEDREPAPLLALEDVREVHLHDGHGEELERVADRPRVVRPGTGIRDHAVRPLVRLVAPVDELALVVRLPAARRALELEGPLVDPRLELGEPETAVELGITASEHVEIDAVQHRDPHGADPMR